MNFDSDVSDFVEVDPSGRYGRYNEILGKGASKTVYKAFDEYEGIEVAWNQVKLYDFLRIPEELERLYSEIHLLKTLKHKNIMKLYTSWVDTANRNINFVTEMFTSGTLRQYRLKHKRVNIRAVKHWCRQILRGLVYLHSHDPPVIHRDLKCDNIFVNGNHGEVKIGDLGLASILRKSHAAHCVGTPEFMAPEIYEEEYNELVDIYSFGMCVLEMATFEYPYSECTNTAQIYQKVISGKKPDGLLKVKDTEVREFIEKCLATVSCRLSARQLLNDPFLQIVDCEKDLRLIDCQNVVDPFHIRQPFLEHCGSDSSFLNGYSNGVDYESYNDWEENTGIELFKHHVDDHSPDVDITIKGKIRDDGSIFLRLRITDKEGHIRNIYFPFNIELDSALSVATEMVEELNITDQDVIIIADMIDGEMSSLVPEWKSGSGIEEEESPRFSTMKINSCQNCSSNHTSIGSFTNFQCPNGCATAIHGRFEEVTYEVDASEKHQAQSSIQVLGQSNFGHHDQIWNRCLSVGCSSPESGPLSQSDEEHAKSGQSKVEKKAENENPNDQNELQWEHRWLKSKYLLESREVKEISSKSSTPRSSQGEDRLENSEFEEVQKTRSLVSCSLIARNCEAMEGCFSNGSYLLPNTLHRTTSLPVDAVYI